MSKMMTMIRFRSNRISLRRKLSSTSSGVDLKFPSFSLPVITAINFLRIIPSNSRRQFVSRDLSRIL